VNFGWFGINIAAPVVLPMIGLSLVSWTMPLNEAQRDKSKIAATIQDGQLGWLAVAWSAASVYESYAYMATAGQLVDWFGWLLALEFLLALGGMFIAAGGAITASSAPRADRKYVYGSTIVTSVSALAFCYVQTKVS
jgi:hypothetical protein